MMGQLAVNPSLNREEALQRLKEAPIVAVDTETVSFEDPTLLTVAVASSPEFALFFSPDEPDLPKDFLSRVPIVFQNGVFDLPILKDSLGIGCYVEADTMLLAQSNGYPASLESLSIPFNFPHRKVTSLLINPETGRKIPRKTLADVPFLQVGEICAQHAQGTYKIWDALKLELNRAYLLDWQLINLTLKLHRKGIRVDSSLAQAKCIDLITEIDQIRTECSRMGFNPASPHQVGIALSQEGFFTSMTYTGRMRTGEEDLLPLKDKSKVASLTLRFRKLNKLNSTYYVPLLGKDRVYPKYNIVRTGRYSSSPNIQNIPMDARDCYLPEEGQVFWDSDAHQIEPRIMAFLSGDPVFISDVRTGDVYTPIAQRYNIPRQVAKTLLLAASYGAGAEKIQETGGFDKETAERLLREFFTGYKVFADWSKQMETEANIKGYVTTLFGRKRSLDSMMEGEYGGYDPLKKVVNSIVQGSGADILKANLDLLFSHNVDIVTHIHDEILCSVEPDFKFQLRDRVDNVEISWATKMGNNWKEVGK